MEVSNNADPGFLRGSDRLTFKKEVKKLLHGNPSIKKAVDVGALKRRLIINTRAINPIDTCRIESP